MVLVDTSVWVSHFRKGDSRLATLLIEGLVICHPFIIGELACGNFKNRKEIIGLLKNLPMVQIPEDEEVLQLIEEKRLMGLGIGYVDAHLLAAALINKAVLWTFDKPLKTAASQLDVFYPVH